jgi:hypothetical protein
MTDGTSGASVRLSYLKIRDVSTKDEEENKASTYVAVLPATEILKIGTDGNLRSYIPEHAGKKRNLVHKAIAKTINEKPDRFSQMNSGFLIGASKIAIDDNKRIVTLRHASVNNGAQSQGEIRRYIEECEKKGEPPNDFAVRCELSIEPDDATRTDIAVARNTATRIEGISIAGKHGYFDALNESFKRTFPDMELARSETNVEDHFVDTRQLLQVLWAMMPQELEPEGRKSIEARMRAYKNAAFCLQDFVEIVDRQDDPGNAARYAYFIDMAGVAWKEYQRWRTHKLWNDKRLYERLGQAKRDDDGQIQEISDGIVFPILSALSRFMQRNSLRRKWQLVYPAGWEDEDLLLGARRQLKECDGRPMLMGRSGSAYEALMTVTEMAGRLADRYSQLAASGSLPRAQAAGK